MLGNGHADARRLNGFWSISATADDPFARAVEKSDKIDSLAIFSPSTVSRKSAKLKSCSET
ncbi:protein of unknown function [Hyphomicrobium sp. MC1]|nr:protein of unknown function [Hyphomicrobium sp. MC1]